MKTLRLILIAATVISLLVAASVQIGRASLTSQAKLYQRIEKSAEAELFGELGTKIGTPQLMIISDPKAVLPDKLEDGTALLDETYLKENNVYPLQLKTVNETSGIATLASIAVALVSLGLVVVINKNLAKAERG
jgi:hypothetical protein